MNHDSADYQTLIRHAARWQKAGAERATPSSPAQRQPSAAALPRGSGASTFYPAAGLS